MTRDRRKIHGAGLVLVLSGLLAGCASAPPPIQLMDRAQAEIRAARNAGAVTAAPETLADAERSLAAAQQFTADNDNDKATDKAAEAEAAAATARARADLVRLDQQIRQQTAVNDGLKVDLERREAAAAAAQRAAMAAPAAASSSATPASPASANAPMDLPSIQLGAPATPSSSGGPPASAGSSGGAGMNP